MIEEFSRKNWFKVFVAVVALVFLILYAFGKYVELKAYNFQVSQMAADLCQYAGDEEAITECVEQVGNAYIHLPFTGGNPWLHD